MTKTPHGSDTRALAIATAFRRLAEGDPHDLTGLADDLVDDCTRLLGVAAAGVMLVDAEGRLHVLASSSEEVHTLELFEVQAGEGPCLDSYRSGRTVTVTSGSDLRHRWPVVASRAGALSLGLAYAVPVRHHDHVIGALNLFAPRGLGLSDSDLGIAEALAVALASLVVQGQLVDAAQTLAEQLQNALTSRVRIEQAKGIVAASLEIELQSAFGLLRAYARSRGLRLSDVAGAVAGRSLQPGELGGPVPLSARD
jgi:hypothetical protein